jgi:hypothetical protein
MGGVLNYGSTMSSDRLKSYHDEAFLKNFAQAVPAEGNAADERFSEVHLIKF